jgi:hypothetical protein
VKTVKYYLFQPSLAETGVTYYLKPINVSFFFKSKIKISLLSKSKVPKTDGTETGTETGQNDRFFS